MNLSQALTDLEHDKTIRVELREEEQAPTLLFSFAPRLQQQLIDKHIKKGYSPEGTQIHLENMQDMGLSLLKWLTGWENFEGEMSRDVLKRSFDSFPNFAEKVASLFFSAFIDKQESNLKKREEERKN